MKDDTIIVGIHQLGLTELLGYHTGIEERIQGHLPVLVDELEADDAPAHLQVGKGKSLTDDAIAIDATHGDSAAQTLGVHLLEEHGVQVVDHVPRGLARNAVLGTQTVGERQFVFVNRNVLTPQEGVGQVAVAFAVDKIRSADQSGFGIDTLSGIAVVVAAVVNHAETDLGGVAAMGFVVLDDAGVHIVLIKGCLGFITFQVDAVDFGVVIGQTGSPIKMGHVEEGTLHAAHEAELITVDKMIAALADRVTDQLKVVHHRVGGASLETVEAKELVFLGVEIGDVDKEFGVLHHVGHVAIEAEYARAFGVT